MTATDRIRRKCLYVLLPSALACLAFLLAFTSDGGRFDYRDMDAAGYAARARFDGGEVLWDRSAFVYHMPVASFVAALRSDDVGRAIRWRGGRGLGRARVPRGWQLRRGVRRRHGARLVVS